MTKADTRNDIDRHREWLDRKLPKRPKFETVSPTYVIRVSREEYIPATLARNVREALANIGQGADILEGTGIWDGTEEPSVTVIVQATPTVLETVLGALANVSDIRWAHVERHDVPTSYIDLKEWK